MNVHNKMTANLHDDLTNNEVATLDVLAIQLEMEFKQLSKWREKRNTIITCAVSRGCPEFCINVG
jgi:hypothetical protein